MTSRRDVLRSMGIGAAAIAASTGGVAAAAVRPSMEAFAHPDQTASSPWWVIAPLRAGNRVGKGWYIGGLSDVRDGAAVLQLVNRDGREVGVHVCARAGRGKGVAQTALFDLVTMDGRDGDAATPEDMGRVVMSLARRIRHNESNMAGDLRPFANMMSHADRLAMYGPERLLFGESV